MRVPGVLDFYGEFRIGGPFTVIGGFNPNPGFATTNNASRSHEFYAFRRVRRREVDVPVAGCGGALGGFRVLNFADAPDGRRVVNGGDGWVIAVEFGETPRAFSVLTYGQSPDPASPHHADQAAMFAAGHMKPVRYGQNRCFMLPAVERNNNPNVS